VCFDILGLPIPTLSPTPAGRVNDALDGGPGYFGGSNILCTQDKSFSQWMISPLFSENRIPNQLFLIKIQIFY